MSAIATFNEIPIHKIRDIEDSRRDVSSAERTAGGKERRDVVTTPKREWRVTTSPMLTSLISPIETHLDEISWGYGDWWCWDFDVTETKRCRIDADSWRKASITGLPNHRILSFTVIEQ